MMDQKIKNRINSNFWNVALKMKIFGVLFGVFAFGRSADAAFMDVDITHPYYHAIEYLRENEVVQGFKEKNYQFFKPLEVINRAEVLKIILLSADISPQKEVKTSFSDVPSDAWFSGWVASAYDLKIVKGFQDGNFHPATKVNRAEFVKMVLESHAVEIPEKSGDTPWYAPYFSVAENYRLLPASNDPEGWISRGEAAEIIYRIIWVKNHDFTGKYIFSGFGKASFYSDEFAGKNTSSGEKYDPGTLTAAHRTLPFGTRLKVYNENGDFVVVRINDRGPYGKSRVLDLSSAAFSRLAPLSTGVIPVEFEVFSEPQDDPVAIPEQIRPKLSDGSKKDIVPEVFKDRLSAENDFVEVEAETTLDRKAKIKTQPLFLGESVGTISTEFYTNIKLRSAIPQKVPKGFVTEIKGTVFSEKQHETAVAFLHNRSTGEQLHFKTTVSGKNFVIPIAFFELGKFDLGIIFDNQKESKVAQIEVVNAPNDRKYPSTDILFASDIEISLVPEEKKARFDWAGGVNRLTKMVFFQKNGKQETVFFTGGISHFYFPHDFFKNFTAGMVISLDIYQAESKDESLENQFTNWKKVAYKNYELVEGFPDTESGYVEIKPFRRYYRMPQKMVFDGKILEPELRLSDTAYITEPDGQVKTEKINFKEDHFSFNFIPRKKGTHIIEVISDHGNILFNRAVYINDYPVLPVSSKTQTIITKNSFTAIYDWINRIRAKQNLSALSSDIHLRNAAQEYAERMSSENFISHTDPQGKNTHERLKELNLIAYGENLAFGSEINVALAGLENSGSHRHNIVSDRWTKMGVGLSQNDNGDFYIVQLFAK